MKAMSPPARMLSLTIIPDYGGRRWEEAMELVSKHWGAYIPVDPFVPPNAETRGRVHVPDH